MDQAHRRHVISDHLLELLAPHLSGQYAQWGGIVKDNRQFINAVLWIHSTLRSWLMIDATDVKDHTNGTGSVGGNQDMGLTKSA
jgi:hypothetical protein